MALSQSVHLAVRGVRNYITRKPLVVSFEVTHSCTCNCRHCDRGGRKEENNLLSPPGYAHLVSTLRPSVVQLSGGEPLLRPDIAEIARAMKKRRNGLPHTILVTNASLLDEQKYLTLKQAGVDRFSVSLDFPDERHDDFRRHPGLYAHLEQTVPRLAALGNDDIALNCAITRMNLPHLVGVADKAEQWGVSVSYSAYGILRTGETAFFVSSGEDLKLLHQQIARLIELKRRGRRILNSPFTLMRTYEFFRLGQIPNCRTGTRFLVVRPNGYLVPCSMRPHPRVFSTQKQLVEEFSESNTCGACYVAIRAYSDKTFGRLVKDSLAFVFSSSH